MSDFDLNNSRWYCTMKIGAAVKGIKNDAAAVIDRARVLANFSYDAVVGQELADAENAATEALFALKIARQEYERHAKSTLIAAE